MFSNPERNINQFVLAEGWHIADFGVGSGAYAIAAARRVGSLGRVYVLDIKKNLLLHLQKEAREEGVLNIEIIHADLEQHSGSKLGSGTMDAVLVSNILFQVENRNGLVIETRRVLKQRGRVLVVDWTDSFSGLGPEPEKVVSEKDARKLFEEVGFEFERSIDAGTHHYGIIFKKK